MQKNACWVFETVQIISIIIRLICFTEKVYGSSPYSPILISNNNNQNGNTETQKLYSFHFLIHCIFVVWNWSLGVACGSSKSNHSQNPKARSEGARSEQNIKLKWKQKRISMDLIAIFFLESRIRLNKPIFLSSIINNNNLRMGIPYGFASFPVPITIKELLILPFFGILTYFWWICGVKIMTRIRGDADVTQLKWNSKSHGYRNGLLYLLTPQRLKNE